MATKLIEASFREQKRYSLAEFRHAFDGGKIELERVQQIIRRLKSRQMIKQVKSKEEKDLSELAEEEISEDSLMSEGDKYFVFTFVGILWLEGCIIKCYPKYCCVNDGDVFDKEELVSVFKALRKYNRKADKEYIYDATIDEIDFTYEPSEFELIEMNGEYDEEDEW